jgi:hypothetical protein
VQQLAVRRVKVQGVQPGVTEVQCYQREVSLRAVGFMVRDLGRYDSAVLLGVAEELVRGDRAGGSSRRRRRSG